MFGVFNRPFAASYSRGTKQPCWKAKVALAQDKQRKLKLKLKLRQLKLKLRQTKEIKIKLKLYLPFVGLVSVRVVLSSMAVFVPREWLAAKGLLKWTAC